MCIRDRINPHFLYNTLEMIRNLALWEPEKTSSLILKLTQILRYSIDRSRQVVCLEEDIRYLSDYLDIQKCRFSDRFVCEMEIEPECMKCMAVSYTHLGGIGEFLQELPQLGFQTAV